MKKVEKSVNEMMEWMNNVMNAQAKKSLDQDPVVRAHEIKAKIRVSIHIPCQLQIICALYIAIFPVNFFIFFIFTSTPMCIHCLFPLKFL
jgi:hypothetical protein